MFDRTMLIERFEDMYAAPPTHVIRVPGRVNLIGEHIDYCGLSVLPMAIDRAVWLALRPNHLEKIRIATTVAGFTSAEFSTLTPIVTGQPGDWVNYVRAAAETLLTGNFSVRRTSPPGFDAIVDADLPLAMGLSSSSALVVATALALVVTAGRDDLERVCENNPSFRLELADKLARGERYVGTAGGGMDQAACLMGCSECAIRVDFDPLAVTPIPVPPDWSFIVAHSGDKAEKSGAAQQVYNQRTEEARRAAQKAWSIFGEPNRFQTAGDQGLRSYKGLLGYNDILEKSKKFLDSTSYRRFRHILTEAHRVSRAEEAMRAGKLAQFGKLLTASHRSLRDDYEVSTHQLDTMVETALDSGASGARLTGAGLGGSIVAICPANNIENVLAGLSDETPFIVRPSEGATVSLL